MADITEFPIPTEVLDPASYPEFVGPQGEQGIQGIQGEKGDPGDVTSSGEATDGQVLTADGAGGVAWADDLSVLSDITGITGADRITNLVSLTQAEYDALTPDSSTLYVITD